MQAFRHILKCPKLTQRWQEYWITAERAREGYGQSTAALPGTSDVDFLGDLKRVVDLNAYVAYGAFDPIARWA
jgi:hypothetical protein